MKTQEINESKYISELCENMIREMAIKENMQPEDLSVRLDMKTLDDKPIVGLFDRKKLVRRSSIRELVRVGGGGLLTGLITKEVIKQVKAVFVYAMEIFNQNDPQTIFAVLYLKKTDVEQPAIALYKDCVYDQSLLIENIIGSVSNENTEDNV